MIVFFFFFFQAEDGIRDYKVTGVQTCALPIWSRDGRRYCSDRSDAGTPYRRRQPGWRRHAVAEGRWRRADRKSTRLNSSHLVISYAVFCLKKKKNIYAE